MAKKDVKPADFALKMLGIRDYSEAELRARMETKGYKPGDIDAVLLLIKEKKFINDGALASKIIEKYTLISPSSKEFITMKLDEKGIKKEAYAKLLEEISDLEQAKKAFKMKFKGPFTRENSSKTRQKAGNYLATKGFDYDIIENILNSELKGGTEIE